MMKTTKRTVALGIAMTLLLSTSALAVDRTPRQEDIDTLFTTLKEGHPNLFASTQEQTFLTRIAELEQLPEDTTELEFALALQSLVGLAQDSHTSISIGKAGENVHILPMTMTCYEGKWVLSTAPKTEEAWLGSEITAVNGLPMAEFVERFRPAISADNDVWFARQFKQLCSVQEILEWLKVAEPGKPVVLSLTTAQGKTGQISLTALDGEAQKSAQICTLKQARKEIPATEADKKQYYFSLPLDKESYYIQYNRCQNNPELPMTEFAARVKADLEKGGYKKVLVDLRNNTGGSDGVISPLLEVLCQLRLSDQVQIFGLMGENTFSSGIINAVMLKEVGAVLVGSPTGGSVDHFGAVNSYTLPNSGLTGGYSTKFIDMETILAAGVGYGVEPMKPDITANQSLSDYLAGRDTAVETVLSSKDIWTLPADSAILSTRGGFVEQLWSLADADETADWAGAFQDVYPYASYVPALNWAQEEGMVQGDGQGLFYPTKLISDGEKTLILERFRTWSAEHLSSGETEQIIDALLK